MWTGTGYLMVWYERPSDGTLFHLYVQRLSARLEPLDPAPRRLFSTEDGVSRGGPQLALGPGVVGLVYKHSRMELRTPRPPQGPPDGMEPEPSPVSPDRGPRPTLVAIQTRFLRLDLDGHPLGPERPVAANAAPWNGDHAAIAWDPVINRWGVAFEGSEPGGGHQELYFAQLGPEGELGDDPVVLSKGRYHPGSFGQSVVTRPGGGFAVAFGDGGPVIAEVGSDGVRRRVLARMPHAGRATLGTDGTRYAMVFFSGTPRRVHVTVAPVGGDPDPEAVMPVGDAGHYSGGPDLRFAKPGVEIVYVQQDGERRSRIHRRVLTPSGLGPVSRLTQDPSRRASHSWPIYAEGGPCPGLFTYGVFDGDRGQQRAFVPAKR